jgi:hypothetical protein
MNTVKLSPKRQLEALFGHVASTSSRPRCGDWMKLSLGDTVRELEGRHLGRVERIEWGHKVIVKWHETGWLSEFRLSEVERVR